MPNFRYPISPPSAVVVDPFSVAFDYVPEPLHYPLTDEENRELYTTRITINAVAAQTGADRIANVFPRSNVRFLRNEPGGLDPEVLAQRYLDETDTDPLQTRGAWLTFGHPADIRDIRKAAGNPIFPTVILYHDVIIDRPSIDAIIRELRNAKITTKDLSGNLVEVTGLQEKLVLWLTGKATAKAVWSQFNSRLMPLIPQVNGVHTLRVSALMMDGNGIDEETLTTFQSQLEANLSTGTPLFQEVPFIFPIPVSRIFRDLPISELHSEHRDHPLALSWPAPPARWSVFLFSFVDVPRNDITNLTHVGGFRIGALTCQVNDQAEFPIGKAGLFFFRTAEGQTNLDVKVFQTIRDEQTVHEQKYLSLFTREGEPVTGDLISLGTAGERRGSYRLFVGDTPAGPPGTSDHYFGVPVNLNNLQDFINAISVRHMSTLSTAGAFARTMGYLAEAVAEYLSWHRVTVTELVYPSDGTYQAWHLNALVPPSASYPYLIAVAVPLLMSNPDQATFRDYLVKLDYWRQHAGIDLTSVRRTAWMDNHNDGPPGSGWKIFDLSSYDNSGRADHFLFNCALRLMYPYVIYHAGAWVHVERDENNTDLKYNEKGAEFTEWGMSLDYGPNKVEQKILSMLVDQATL